MPIVTVRCPGIPSLGLKPHAHQVTVKTAGFAPLNKICDLCTAKQRAQSVTMGMPTTLIPPRFLQNDCSICGDKFESNDVLCTLLCGHAFHPYCIIPWIEGQGGGVGRGINSAQRPSCPFCKQGIIGGITGMQKYRIS